jgi:hypothetical protein
MALVRLISPESESEIIAVVAMLEAHQILCYVRGGGFGGLYPGVQINSYNTRDIMIPEEKATLALELLRDFQSQPVTEPPEERLRKSGKLRNLLELLLFGWFVPGSGGTGTKPPDSTPNPR